MPAIREERPSDREAIRRVHGAAFGGDEEGRLVDDLRAGGLVVASIVAEEAGAVVGHILFSELPVDVEGPGNLRVVSLAPLAVVPDRQRRGIGSALVRDGLKRCREKGVDVVIVLGHPEYYPRFGFSAGKAARLRAPFSGPAFMALELSRGALDGVTGIVRYPDAFGLTDTPPE